MRIERIRLTNFRNYKEAALSLPPGIVFVTGPNGAGKTNFIEAIALATLGRSPRAAADADLILRDEKLCYVQIRAVKGQEDVRVDVIIQRQKGKQVLWNQQPLRRRADLFSRLPLVTFFPEDLDLVKGSPSRRRRFLDLLAAQCEPQHIHDVRQFNRILQQRNSLLRNVRRGGSMVDAADLFEEQFLQAGVKVMKRRLSYLSALNEASAPVQKEVGGEVLSLHYAFSDGQVFAANVPVSKEQLLERSRPLLTALRRREKKRGYSLWGPHRDDVVIRLDGHDAKVFGSQGQQRTAVLALKAGEIELLTAIHGETPLVILDDVLSELDSLRVRALLKRLLAVEQLFITTTKPAAVQGLTVGAVLTVKDGQVTDKVVNTSG